VRAVFCFRSFYDTNIDNSDDSLPDVARDLRDAIPWNGMLISLGCAFGNYVDAIVLRKLIIILRARGYSVQKRGRAQRLVFTIFRRKEERGLRTLESPALDALNGAGTSRELVST